MGQKSESGPQAGFVAPIAFVGSEIVGFAVVGVLIDWWFDFFSSIPWGTLILTPLGVTIAFWHLIRMTKK